MDQELKKQLLRMLSENGKRSSADLAERLALTPEFVEEAVTELEKNNTIVGYKAIFDDTELPEHAVKAIIEVKTRPERDGGFDKIARRLSKFPQVSSVYLMSGGFDLMVEVKGHDLNEVALFVASKLSTIDGVLSTATHFLLKKYKESGKLFQEEEVHERLQIVP